VTQGRKAWIGSSAKRQRSALVPENVRVNEPNVDLCTFSPGRQLLLTDVPCSIICVKWFNQIARPSQPCLSPGSRLKCLNAIHGNCTLQAKTAGRRFNVSCNIVAIGFVGRLLPAPPGSQVDMIVYMYIYIYIYICICVYICICRRGRGGLHDGRVDGFPCTGMHVCMHVFVF
jgi:hypothetical protein